MSDAITAAAQRRERESAIAYLLEIETRHGFARRYRITETGKLLLLATRNSPSPSGA